MKKIYILLALVSVLFSCSEWKYSKGVKWKQPEYHAAQTKHTEIKENQVLAQNDEPAAQAEEEVALPETVSEPAAEIGSITHETLPEPEEMTILVKEEDSVVEVSADAMQIALDAEHDGKVSRTLGIIGLVATVIYIFAFVGLIVSIIGLTKGIKSLKADYNTPEGVRMARTGVVTSSIVIGLNVLAILLVALLILALL